MVKVKDLFSHDGDDVCIADSATSVERLATNSAPKFANVISEVASQTREFTEAEDWYVFYVSDARIKEKFRINGWEARIKVRLSVGRKETIAVYREETDAIGCFSATDPLLIRTETLNGADTVALIFFTNIPR